MSTKQSQIEKEYEIQVKDHPGQLLQAVNGARKERRFCDFLIKVGSKEIHAHKIILSEGSDYFKAMFSSRMVECESGVAEMKDVDPDCMCICIEYIYTGKITVLQSKIHSLLKTAHLLQLLRLCDEVGSVLASNLDANSIIATRTIAHIFDIGGLKEQCDEYAIKNFKLISTNDQFKHANEEFVKFLIATEENKEPESVKCDAILLWGNFDVKNRKLAFQGLFLTLDLSKMGMNYLDHLEENEPLVYNSTKCMRKLFKSANQARRSLEDRGAAKEDTTSSNVVAVFDVKSESIQAFDPDKKTWTRCHNIFDNITRLACSAVAVGSEIYVLLVDGTNLKLNYTDPAARWIYLPKRNVTTGEVKAVSYNGKIYTVDDSSTSSTSCEQIDLATATWSKLPDKPVAGSGMTVVEAEGMIYCVGGLDVVGGILSDVVRFCPTDNKWSHVPDMPTARYDCGASVIDRKIFVMGGVTRERSCKTVECYDIPSQTWSELAEMGNRHATFKACIVKGKIYVVGGYGSNAAIEEFDPAEGTWKIVETMKDKNILLRASVALKL